MSAGELDDSLRQVATTVVSTLTTKEYADVITFTLLAYDYIVTIDVEIAHIWKQRFTGATAFFFLNRYMFILSVCLKWIFRSYASNDSPVRLRDSPVICVVNKSVLDRCVVLGISVDFLDFFTITITVKLIFTLRTWAIWMRSGRILVCVGLLGIATVGMDILGVQLGLTFQQQLLSRHGSTAALTLAKILLALRNPSSPSLAFTLQVISGTIVVATGNIVINRMLLNLRQVALSDVEVSGGIPPEISQEGTTFATNTFIGNLGAPMCTTELCGDEVVDQREDENIHDNAEFHGNHK
ncbi:hypothetical protein BD410DRAFT_840697 [Rickenella mellea]|uniref:DUF6533 domain-containing protein n=1 Tax=Rickenella mellea TaxID=50990 RepID=A0A4Y7Q1R2_9AGAM|nr:hypothetical protein BD410DRAFT_840697 [Rickenella mellea]